MQEMTDDTKKISSINKSEIESIQKRLRDLGFTPDLEAILTILTSLVEPEPAVHDSGPFPWYLSRFTQIGDIPNRPDLQNSVRAIKDYIYEVCQVKEAENDKITKTYDSLFAAMNVGRISVSRSPESSTNVEAVQRSPLGTIYMPVDIVTTNYDLCIEHYCSSRKIPMTTGFNADATGTRLVFNINNLKVRTGIAEYDNRIRLHKLHGSIDQWITDKGEIILLPARQEKTLYGDNIRRELLIYPIQTKYIYQDPFFELFHLFQEKLKGTPVCIVIGYSFRDDAVNNVFYNAVKEKPELKIFLIDPVASAIKPRLSRDLQRNVYQIDRRLDDPQLLEILKDPIINWIPGDDIT